MNIFLIKLKYKKHEKKFYFEKNGGGKLNFAFLLLLFVTVIFSCDKNNYEPNVKEKILQIHKIPIIEGRLSFKNKEEFKLIREEFYKNQKEYKEYLLEKKFPCFLVEMEKLKKIEISTIKETEIKQIVSDHKLIINKNKEVDYPHEFLFENALYNFDGELIINGIVQKLPSNVAKSDEILLEERATEKVCEISQDWDISFCNKKRFKGTTILRFEEFATVNTPSPGCGVFYLAEGRSNWYARQFWVWWPNNASVLTAKLNYSRLWNNTKGQDKFCDENYSPSLFTSTLSNTSEVTVFANINCISSTGTGGCFTVNSQNHGAIVLNTYHSGSETGSCGSPLKSMTINCQ